MDHRQAGVVLAAGGGSRFQGKTHKLLAPFRGKPVIAWSLDAATRAGFERLIVVAGAVTADQLQPLVESATAGWLDPPQIHLVDNPRWAEGQASSVQLAVSIAQGEELDAIVVGLADQPLITAATWAEVAGVESPIGATSYGAALGPPVRLHRQVWPLLPTDGDFGARHLIREHPGLVSTITCSDNPVDIDTAEELRRWN